MAIDMFLKISDIKGESTDARHKGEIDVLAWSWEMSNPGTPTGAGSGAGKVSVQGISITKFCDAATAPLIMACCSGKRYKEAMLTVRKAAKTPLEYLKISLKDVLITSQSTGSEGVGNITENITLNFAEFKLDYVTQKPDGSAGATHAAGWNIVKNIKA
jgi:type VI secretion system secreted protein Hcp